MLFEGSLSVSHIVLGLGIIMLIAGISTAFSKKTRLKLQKQVIAELPERAAYLGSPERLLVVQRRGYVTIGIAILLIIGSFLLQNIGW